MTTHTLAAFRDDPLRSVDEQCTFCAIASGKQAAHIVYEDQHTIAFLDILPIRKGHTLVIPRSHVPQLSKLSSTQAAQLSRTAVIVSRGLGKALNDERMQMITNQQYAQIVPHVHFHLVPAPPVDGRSATSSSSKREESSTKPASPLLLFGHGREELDDDEAVPLARSVRQACDDAASSMDREDGHGGRTSRL